jgi:signal peptidase I
MRKRKKPFLRRVYEWCQSILVALAIALVIRAFLIQPYRIPSGSMIPTLEIGDQLFVLKCRYGITIPFTDKQIVVWDRPKRGDIIVFRNPKDPDRGIFIRMVSPVIWATTLGKVDLNPHKDFIKRVIGTPGDEVMIRHRQVYINKLPIEEPYKVHRMSYRYSGFDSMDNWEEPIIVPEGHYFVMGDNRDLSSDSRKWGFVPENIIRGKALFIHWPPWRIRWIR